MAQDRKNGVPQYVLDHAPLVHLSSKDSYKPSSFAAILTNTRPQINYKDVAIPNPPLTLDNLDQLNSVGNGGNDIYLTSNVDISTNPKWLQGIQPDANGGTGDEKTAVIIVVDKGNGTVDAFYMYFWAFNWDGVVLEKQLGDHVGDWEHNMIRFINGVPKFVWYSQHANGEAFKFEILKKDKSGKRPLAYAANGSHALFATPGTHDHTIPNLNLPIPLLLVDETDAGPLYDPLSTSHIYTYTPSTNTFTPTTPSTNTPTSYLHFRGRWGDQEYPETDKRQQELAGNKKYVGGPTGPADKGLDRRDVWPAGRWSGGQKVRETLGGVEGVRGIGEKVRDLFKGFGSSFGKKGSGVQRVSVSGESVK